MDMPRKYREPGDKRPIYVGIYTEPYGFVGYKLLQRNTRHVSTPYTGMDGDQEIRHMTWYREEDAQKYLDALAKKRNWRCV